ncbi:MAG: hypothetical protein MK066_11955 [Crocinitomicaceae bacterium]|nr:hypothetical protein [Crocinitomicaceae bacterium]
MADKNTMTIRKISLPLALSPIIIMVLLIGWLNLYLGIDLRFVLLLSSIGAGVVAKIVGVSIKEMLDSFAQNVQKSFGAILILISIGGVVGTWMYSGTVPYLIYWGLMLIHPDFILVTAFLVTACVSLFTGTSWGSAATAGVAFMGIGIGMGVPSGMLAGAIISGAVLGDKFSPVSDTTNICALAVDITVYDHIRGMRLNVLLSGAIAILAFVILGMMNGGVESNSLGGGLIISELNGLYNFNVLMLLPPLVIFMGGYKGYNPVLVMISSCFVAIIIGMFVNGFSLAIGANSMMKGFQLASIVPDNESFSEISRTLLNRGGFEGMTSGAVLFCFLAIAFGSMLEVSGALNRLMKAMLSGVKSSFGLVYTAFFAGATLNGVSGSAMFSILTVGQLFSPTFKERKIPLNVLSRSMENSMTLLESLLPWHVTAIYMSTTLGVKTTEYAPYAFFNVLGIALFFVLIRKIRKKTTLKNKLMT